MTPACLPSLFGLVLVATITPGPNNLVVLAASATGSGQRVVAAFAGVLAGTSALIVMNWFGAEALFETRPALRSASVALGSAYMAWCGLGLVREALARTGHDPGVHLPSSAVGLALFQLANPKAWVLCIAAVSAMQARESGAIGLALLAALFVVAMSVSLTAWALLGRLLPDLREPSAAAAPVLALLGLALVLCSMTLLGSAL